jgi:hypothetical protein
VQSAGKRTTFQLQVSADTLSAFDAGRGSTTALAEYGDARTSACNKQHRLRSHAGRVGTLVGWSGI